MLRPKLMLLAAATAAGALISGCGGGGGASGGARSATSTATQPTTTPAAALTHADPVALLPTTTEVRAVIRPTSSPTRYDQVLNMDTLTPAFATATVQARRLSSGAAEMDVSGPGGRYLSVRVFAFRTLAGASSLWSSFRASTRLQAVQPSPQGAPGEQRVASVQAYCSRRSCLSFRYAFRDQNVLAYVELDGPRANYTLGDAVKIARLTDKRIRESSG
jgi:hypothetical protein